MLLQPLNAVSQHSVSCWLQVVGEAERQGGTVNVRTRDELVREKALPTALLESGPCNLFYIYMRQHLFRCHPEC